MGSNTIESLFFVDGIQNNSAFESWIVKRVIIFFCRTATVSIPERESQMEIYLYQNHYYFTFGVINEVWTFVNNHNLIRWCRIYPIL
jgi:hypothetical protein